MTRFPILIMSLCWIIAPASAQKSSISTQHENPHYSFYGFELYARINKKYLPIVSADEKGVYVQKGKRLKRVTWTTPCMPQSTTFITDKYANINGVKSGFIYARIPRGERSAFEKMQQSEQTYSAEIARLRMQGNAEAAEALESELEAFKDELDSDIRNDTFSREGYADSVDFQMQITPSSDIAEAYCAIVVSYQTGSPEAGEMKKRVGVRVRRIGELLQGIPESVSFTAYTGEGDYSQSRIAVHLYSGDGTPIATNLSPRLKILNEEERKALR